MSSDESYLTDSTTDVIVNETDSSLSLHEINDSVQDFSSGNNTNVSSNDIEGESSHSENISNHQSQSIIEDSEDSLSNELEKDGGLSNSFVRPRRVKPIIESRSPSPETNSSSRDLNVISDSESDHDQTEESVQSSPEKAENKVVPQPKESQKQKVTQTQYDEQKNRVLNLYDSLTKAKNALRVVNLNALSDKGKLLLDKEKSLASMLEIAEKVFENMTVIPSEKPKPFHPSWENIQSGVSAVQPKTFGKQAVATYNAQKALTVDRLEQLHGSLKTCPTEDDLCEDPKHLKVELMLHQKRALAWLMWRENQKPSGGILADDMGLGKTLTMISLLLKSREMLLDDKNENDDSSDDESSSHRKNHKYSGGTLVICPASLLEQWSGEVASKCRRGMLTVELYHGQKRETRAKNLALHDIVITTYTIVMNESDKNGAVFGVRWKRIILDEGHQIRNYKSQTSVAVCRLSAKSRWILTGTPIHNKELDMFALLKFLRCSPFDDYVIWRRWVADKSTGGQERLHTVISSLMLRRTKAELIEKGSLQLAMERKYELVPVKLVKDEMGLYQKLLLFSKSLFAQFLQQHADRELGHSNTDLNIDPRQQQKYLKIHDQLIKSNGLRHVKQHHILVLLLRLRQLCCHPRLISKMFEGNIDLGDDDDDEDNDDINLLEQLEKLKLNDNDEDGPDSKADENAEKVDLQEATKGLLNSSNPIFSEYHLSSKMKVVLDLLRDKIINGNDKAIVVSQFTSFLTLMAIQLKERGIPFVELNGSVPIPKRMPIVDTINDPNSGVKILLLSLTAGGVGLNLVGANHLFLLDLHWNPQLENQAQDRIYRVGQGKPVFVYKFIASDTIEGQIKHLQERKLNIAESMITGSKQVSNKLSLNDLKMLFDM